jgi:hypothetical protein
MEGTNSLFRSVPNPLSLRRSDSSLLLRDRFGTLLDGQLASFHERFLWTREGGRGEWTNDLDSGFKDRTIRSRMGLRAMQMARIVVKEVACSCEKAHVGRLGTALLSRDEERLTSAAWRDD